MQINITNGTLTQIQETLTANSGYTLPTTISVSGATSNYNNSTGAITLTNLTQTMSITASGESSQVNKISVGTLKLAKASVGNSDIASMWLGNAKIYEKGSPTPSGYDVTFTASGNWLNFSSGIIIIYDGQDNKGTLLLNQNPANKLAFPMTLQVSSGYCFVKCNGGVINGSGVITSDYSMSGTKWQRICLIDKNGSIDINVDNWDD